MVILGLLAWLLWMKEMLRGWVDDQGCQVDWEWLEIFGRFLMLVQDQWESCWDIAILSRDSSAGIGNEGQDREAWSVKPLHARPHSFRPTASPSLTLINFNESILTPAYRLRLQGQARDQRQPSPRYLGVGYHFLKHSRLSLTDSRVTRPHGKSGVVKSKFRTNLPAKTFGASCRIVGVFDV